MGLSDGPLDFLAPTIWLDDSRRFLHVGTRRWPVVFHLWEDIELPAPPEVTFCTRLARVAFENGWAVSVSYGSCTYSDNHEHGIGFRQTLDFTEEPIRVEAAIFHRDTMMGEPAGYVTADILTTMLDLLPTLPSDLDAAKAYAVDLIALVEGER